MLYSQVIFKLNKLNTYAIFGAMFLATTLLASGMYSSTNQVFAEQENEAEINADIEQENKCKKDTECENENKINNSLNIVNNGTQSQQNQSEPETACEDCFTSNLDQDQIGAFLNGFSNQVQQEITTLGQLCEYIDANQGTSELNIALSGAAEASGLTFEQYSALIQCLQDAGFDVDIFA